MSTVTRTFRVGRRDLLGLGEAPRDVEVDVRGAQLQFVAPFILSCSNWPVAVGIKRAVFTAASPSKLVVGTSHFALDTLASCK